MIDRDRAKIRHGSPLSACAARRVEIFELQHCDGPLADVVNRFFLFRFSVGRAGRKHLPQPPWRGLCPGRASRARIPGCLCVLAGRNCAWRRGQGADDTLCQKPDIGLTAQILPHERFDQARTKAPAARYINRGTTRLRPIQRPVVMHCSLVIGQTPRTLPGLLPAD